MEVKQWMTFPIIALWKEVWSLIEQAYGKLEVLFSLEVTMERLALTPFFQAVRMKIRQPLWGRQRAAAPLSIGLAGLKCEGYNLTITPSLSASLFFIRGLIKLWNQECDGCMNVFSTGSPTGFDKDNIKDPMLQPFPPVPSSPGNPIWVIRGKSVGDLKEREGWQWLEICCWCTFASHLLLPIPIHAHTHILFTVHLSNTTFLLLYATTFFYVLFFIGSIEGEKCRPEGKWREERVRRVRVRWEKWKWQGIDCISKNPVAEHKPFWLETWKQEVKRSCQDVFDRASVRQDGSILWESGWSFSL